jgi:uncharacterized protein (DUF983 family)
MSQLLQSRDCLPNTAAAACLPMSVGIGASCANCTGACFAGMTCTNDVCSACGLQNCSQDMAISMFCVKRPHAHTCIVLSTCAVLRQQSVWPQA